MLYELIARYRAGEMDLEEFLSVCAANFTRRQPLGYPETDGNEDLVYGISSMTISNAVMEGKLSIEEAEAIYSALPVAT